MLQLTLDTVTVYLDIFDTDVRKTYIKVSKTELLLKLKLFLKVNISYL